HLGEVAGVVEAPEAAEGAGGDPGVPLLRGVVGGGLPTRSRAGLRPYVGRVLALFLGVVRGGGIHGVWGARWWGGPTYGADPARTRGAPHDRPRAVLHSLTPGAAALLRRGLLHRPWDRSRSHVAAVPGRRRPLK